VDNNYLDLGMNKSGFVHTLPSGRLKDARGRGASRDNKQELATIRERRAYGQRAGIEGMPPLARTRRACE
jgi:hypothetical protein